MLDEPVRSRVARQAADLALVRVAHHYGRTPEFVVLGGLVPELLCSASQWRHAGTTDVDVQVNLEIASGSANMVRLENAIRNADFVPGVDRTWRWVAGEDPRTVVKFELLADLDDQPAGATFNFIGREHMGALNLRGTAFAARDVSLRTLRGRIADVRFEVQVQIAGLAGFLLAKAAAARARQKSKDWYDIAFVLLHNDEGGPEAAAQRVLDKFQMRSAAPHLLICGSCARTSVVKPRRGRARMRNRCCLITLASLWPSCGRTPYLRCNSSPALSWARKTPICAADAGTGCGCTSGKPPGLGVHS